MVDSDSSDEELAVVADFVALDDDSSGDSDGASKYEILSKSDVSERNLVERNVASPGVPGEELKVMARMKEDDTLVCSAPTIDDSEDELFIVTESYLNSWVLCSGR